MSVAGMEHLITRSSLNNVRHASQTSNYLRETLNSQPTVDRHWRWGYLRRQFKLKNLEELYLKYLQRLHLGYFSVFVLLQSLLSLSHAIVTWVTGLPFPDGLSYCIAMVLCWPLMLIVFKEQLVQTYQWISLLVSCFVVVLLTITDLLITLYYTKHAGDLRPAYTTHTLLVCYVFLPLTENIQAFILGLTVTLCHLVVLCTVTYYKDERKYERLASDIVYLLCVNGLGLYFRWMSEVAIRRTFLDRRACLESNSKVEYEKKQEENLMLSIIPQHIIDDVRKDIKNLMQHVNTPIRKKPFSDMYVKEHNDVTILYADVVKYAQLTVSLPVNKLVEILNELFGRFDAASEEHGVLRIKFLGDCYYCVSGVPDQNIYHARNCVALGLDMIEIIKKVREERKLKEILDMRIGIHSGKILSGLLGVCKWQYDVWSRDVIIANNMEQAGRPGKVHVTKETLDLLDNKYRHIPGHGRTRNEILDKYDIETFFIVPSEKVRQLVRPRMCNIKGQEEQHSEERATEDRPTYTRVYSAGGQRRLTGNRSSVQVRRTVTDNLAVGSRRRFCMDDNLYKYQETLRKADEQMDEAIKNMHVGVCDRWLWRENLNPVCLTFENIWWELPFLKQPDPLFKFYIGCAFLVLLGMLTIQCLGLPSSHSLPWIGYGITVGLILALLPLTWTHYIWNKLKDPYEEQDNIPEPSNRFLSLLYRASLKVVWSASARTVLFLLVCVSLTVCTMLEVIECGPTNRNTDNNNTSAGVDELPTECLDAWHITQACSLTLMMTFLFLRIHFLLKFILSVLIVVIYSCGVYLLSPDIFQDGESWNPQLDTRVAHILHVTFLTLTLHLMDRQAEYMNRLNYMWKRQLSQEQEESTTMHMINKMLLENILPVHVADWFLDTSRDHEELYHEEYDTVAVMFASLTEYVLWDDSSVEGANELSSIKLLNQIICDFDQLLFEGSFLRVEKIKVAGWTYMAVCGVDPSRRDSIHSLNMESYSDHVVLVLTRFAAKMMGVLQNINRETFQTFKLRVGISHGRVTAGVIGAQKPHYDIWGHSVNMASRMESTGEPGKIQVTENTATVLQELGIDCTCRGEIKIKSMTELVTTYYVHFDENFELKQTEKFQDSDQDSVIEEIKVRDYEQRYTEDSPNSTEL